VEPGSTTALKEGMLNAYNTMNAIAALLFGGWVLHELKMRGITTREGQDANLNAIGLGTAVLLGITSTVLVYLGATSGAAFPEAPIGVLSTEIAQGLLGSAGLISFAIIMALSCLSTSAAITSMAGDMFQEMTREKLQYRVIVTASTLIGFVLGLVGLSRIVKYTVPWLVLIYPSIILLILCALYYRFDAIRKAVTVGMVVALVFGLGDMLSFYGITGNPISAFAGSLPLGSQGLGWVLPTLGCMVIAQVLFAFSGSKDKGGAA